MKSNSDLYKYLTYYLLTVPKLFDELPQILSSLDSGEIIMTSNIQNIGLRDAIDHILGFLPTIQTKDGWIRDKTMCVIGHIFSKFLDDKVIKQPSSLSLRLFKTLVTNVIIIIITVIVIIIIIIIIIINVVKLKRQDRHLYI